MYVRYNHALLYTYRYTNICRYDICNNVSDVLFLQVQEAPTTRITALYPPPPNPRLHSPPPPPKPTFSQKVRPSSKRRGDI